MCKVVAEDLENNQFSSLVQFLISTSSGPLVQHGKVISITGITRKKVKFLLHKFLHANHLSQYRVLDTTTAFEIVHIKPEAQKGKRLERHKPLKHPVPYGPPIPYLSGVVKPRLTIEWQGKPPGERTGYRK